MKIVLIAPYPKMTQDAQEVCRMYGERVEIVQGRMEEGVRAARRAVADGASVLISRGGTYLRIAEQISLPAVEIAVTPTDVLRALKEARGQGKKFGVAGFMNVIGGMKEWRDLLNVPVVPIEIFDDGEHARREIRRAVVQEGVDCLLGDTSVQKLAAEFRLPYVLIESGKESIWDAVQEAKRIFAARMAEREVHASLRTALDRVHQGLLVIERGSVQFANQTVLQLVGRDTCAGLDIHSCLPDSLCRWLEQPEEGRESEVIQVGSRLWLVDCHTLLEPDAQFVSLSPVDDIESMEERVRQKRADAGHVARYTFDDLYGSSRLLRSIVGRAIHFAQSESSVLIMGETGTGKEMLAQSIHNASGRSSGPFVAVNCAALPEQLLESELFGYDEGAFTGARRGGKSGLFELAHGGTIFLDEIGETPPQVQQRLLRVLQERKVMRIGGERVISVDVRVVAATNQPLWQWVQEGRFRKDLFFRLDVLRLNTVPLRDRPEDIPELLEHLVYTSWYQYKGVGPRPWIDSAIFSRLQSYHWPGNVRELQNMVEYLLATSPQGRIGLEAVEEWMKQKALPADHSVFHPASLFSQPAVEDPNRTPMPQSSMEQIERWAIERALAYSHGDLTKASQRLQLSRTTLWRKIKQWQSQEGENVSGESADGTEFA